MRALDDVRRARQFVPQFDALRQRRVRSRVLARVLEWQGLRRRTHGASTLRSRTCSSACAAASSPTRWRARSRAMLTVSMRDCCYGWPEKPPYRPLTDAVEEVEVEFENSLVRLINLTAEDDDAYRHRSAALVRGAGELRAVPPRSRHWTVQRSMAARASGGQRRPPMSCDWLGRWPISTGPAAPRARRSSSTSRTGSRRQFLDAAVRAGARLLLATCTRGTASDWPERTARQCPTGAALDAA